MNYLTERHDIIRQCRAMVAADLIRGTSGNVSMRVGEGYLITPTGIPYDRLVPEEIVLMGLDGRYEGSIKPSSEWQFHQNVLSHRPDINAVVHTHSSHATAIAVMEKDIPPLHYMVAAAGVSHIPCAPYATFGSRALADHVTKAMAVSRACLLAHHGVIAGHATLAEAVALAATVEEMARLYVLCLSTGREPPLLTDGEMADALAAFTGYGQQPGDGKAA